MTKTILIISIFLITISVFSQENKSNSRDHAKNTIDFNSKPQADSLKYNIETKDGNYYQGQIIEQNEVEIRFRTQNIGDINIQRSAIKKIFVLKNEKIKEGKYWLDNPQSTRYLFSPNAYG